MRLSALRITLLSKEIIHTKDPKKVAYTLTTRNYTSQIGSRGWTPNDGEYREEESGRGWFPSAKVRLFANDKRIQFKNAVHETVESRIKKCGIQINLCSIPIHHYGRLNHADVISKGKEYFLLGKKKIEETGEDINALRELAIQAAEIGEFDEAITIWEQGPRTRTCRCRCMDEYGICLSGAKEFQRSAVSVEKGT